MMDYSAFLASNNDRGMKAAKKYLVMKDITILNEDDQWLFSIDHDDECFATIFVETSDKSFKERDKQHPDREAYEDMTMEFLKNVDEPCDDIPVRFDRVDIWVLSEDRAFLRHTMNVDLGKVS